MFETEQHRLWGTNDEKAISSMRSIPSPPDSFFDGWPAWVKSEYPYYHPDAPDPLPTIDEIEAARLKKDCVLSEDNSKPCRFNCYRVEPYVVKFCANPIMLQDAKEAENLLFLEKNCPDLKVPRVHAAYTHQGGDPLGVMVRYSRSYPDRSRLPPYCYLVINYIPGKALYPSVKDDELSEIAQANVMRKLGDQIRLLRAIPPPGPAYYGRVHHQGWFFQQINWLAALKLEGWLRGPYDSYKDLTDALLENLLYNLCANSYGDYAFDDRVALYLEEFDIVTARSEISKPVLTHLDLGIRNVMVQENEDDKEDPHVWIIDWSTMGWMPAYMDVIIGCPMPYPKFVDAMCEGGDEPGLKETASWLARLILTGGGALG